MKQFLLFFTLLIFGSDTFAQVLFQQDFTDGKDNMITIDNDNKKAHSDVAVFEGSWVVTEELTPGNPAVVNNAWYDPVGKADDWLITPAITGITEKTVLTWTAAAISSSYANTYRVMISPTGGDKIADFTEVLVDIGGEKPSPTERYASLKDYIGKDIRIAFHDYSNDMLLLLVDDIVIQNLVDIDGQLDNVRSQTYVVKNDDVDINFSVTNKGYNKITSMVLEASDGVSTEDINLDNLDLAYSKTYDGVYSYKVTNITKNEITIKIKSVNGVADLNTANDLDSTVVFGVNKRINRKMLAEEATGTWCQWCPRGAVFMAKMKEDYPDDFIGIAVHNQDPMVVSAYDKGIADLPGFGGYPSVVINRQSIIDPEEMPDYFIERTSREVAPVEMSVEQSKVDRKITISGEIEFFSDINDGDFSVVVVVVEDGVKGNSAAYDQSNAYAAGSFGAMGGYESLPNPVPASQMVYNEVGRAIPFGFAGQNTIIPATIKADDSFLFSVNYTSPVTQKLANIHSVLFVVNNATGEIINAAKTESFAVNVDDITELDNVQLSPNPTNSNSYLDINLNALSEVSVNISNNIGQIVASKNYGKLAGFQSLPILTDYYNAGLYYIQLVVNGKATVQKLIVE